MTKKTKTAIKKEITVMTMPETVIKTEKEILLALYKELQERNIRSLSDLENLIARI